MSREFRTARSRLVDLLGTVAGYNDKGYQWSGHDAAQVRQYRSEAQEAVVELIAEIGEEVFSAGLLTELRSGRAVQDGSGSVWEQARAELL